MKLKKSLLFILTLVFLLTGCGSNTSEPIKNEPTSQTISDTEVQSENNTLEEETIPEPFTLALAELKTSNIAMTKKYLDLTINDFPESEYSFHSKVLKSVILTGELRGMSYINNQISTGIDNIAEGLVDQEDLDQLESYINLYLDSRKKIDEELLSITPVVLNEYKTYENDTVDVKYSFYDDNSNLDFFASVGYPIPSQAEFDKAIENFKGGFIDAIITEVYGSDKINYTYLFYQLLNNSMWGEPYTQTYSNGMAEEILKLTENDKYNKIRLNVEEYLEENK